MATIGSVLKTNAKECPANRAVISAGGEWNYDQLDAMSDTVAKGFLALGVERGDAVAVLLSNRIDWLVVCFGAQKLGATVVPINTWYRSREISHVLEHSAARVLVMQPSFLRHNYKDDITELIPQLATEGSRIQTERYPDLRSVVVLDESTTDPPPAAIAFSDFLGLAGRVSSSTLAEHIEAVTPEDIGFVLYTSGSTAQPKAVTLAQGDMLANGLHIGDRRGIEPDDRVWLGTPLFYALGAVNALPAALTHGASLVIQEHFDPGRAIDVIERYHCTVYYGVGTMTRAILGHPTYAPARVASLTKGNAGLSVADKKLTLIHLGIRRAVASYGLTEAYGNSAVGLPDEPLDVKLSTDGIPLPGIEFKLVDPETTRPVAKGQVGLVLLRGRITPGYHKNSQANEEMFDRDGFFSTGDLGVLRGRHFCFYGRTSEMVKTAGNNVSPSEVEEVLEEHPSVHHAAVVGAPDEERGQVLVAFVETKEQLDADEIAAFLRERAASFKVPRRFVFVGVGELPRLASGKIARATLRDEVASARTSPR